MDLAYWALGLPLQLAHPTGGRLMGVRRLNQEEEEKARLFSGLFPWTQLRQYLFIRQSNPYYGWVNRPVRL